MADDVDMAQESYERHLNNALAARLNQHVPAEGPTHCEDCDNEIPQARREAKPGCTRCVTCQNIHELMQDRRN